MAEASAQQTPRSAGKVISGGVWTMAERVISQASQLIVFIAAARVLSPAEFGTFALVSACAILLLRVAEAGWSQYIMSWQGDATIPRQVLFIAILSGMAITSLGVLAGLLLPLIGLSQDTSLLVILFAVWVTLATTSSAQKGMMIWQDKLKSSATAESLGEIAGVGAALAALYSGWGVLSLAVGRLTFQSVHLCISFIATRMAPKPGMSRAELRKLLVFSGQVLSSRMIVNLRMYLATFIIGGFLGPASVGFYRAAERLVGAMAEIVSVPGEVLAWSLFRENRDTRPEGTPPTSGFQTQANLYYRYLLAIALPLFIWLALLGDDLIAGLLGSEWLPALPVVAILALSRAIMTTGLATEPVLSLAGQIRKLPAFTLAFFVLTVAVTLASAPFGLFAIAWAQVAVSVVIFAATIPLLRRNTNIDLVEVLRRARRLIVPLIMGTAVLLLLRDASLFADWPALLRAVGVSVPAVLLYVASLALLDPRLRQIVRNRLRRSPA